MKKITWDIFTCVSLKHYHLRLTHIVHELIQSIDIFKKR